MVKVHKKVGWSTIDLQSVKEVAVQNVPRTKCIKMKISWKEKISLRSIFRKSISYGYKQKAEDVANNAGLTFKPYEVIKIVTDDDDD